MYTVASGNCGRAQAVRRRLAPIRGVPTKKGMERQNEDLMEIFETLEDIPGTVKNAIGGLFGWDGDGNIKPPKSGCS